jgi:catechol 2,3-dioxygenase-like lactoylglutathione lyase family enzyme
MPIFPNDATDLTRLLVVADLGRSTSWYRDVLGAELAGEYGGTSAVYRFVGSWLLLVTGGEPTADKPQVTMAPPADPDRATAELIIAVPDCRAAHAELVARGAAFLADPVEYDWEIRAFFRDPDGHLFEISQRKHAADAAPS